MNDSYIPISSTTHASRARFSPLSRTRLILLGGTIVSVASILVFRASYAFHSHNVVQETLLEPSNNNGINQYWTPSLRDLTERLSEHLIKLNVKVQTKTVVEYPLPGAALTHEIAALEGGDMVFVTQMDNSKLVKLQRNPRTGALVRVAAHTIVSGRQGLHGLQISTKHKDMLWATLQFSNKIVLIDPVTSSVNHPPMINKMISVPFPGRGPHCILEDGNDVWTTLKDSSHVLRVNTINHSDFTLYKCDRKPIMLARHGKSGKVYVTLDLSSRIIEIDSTTREPIFREIDIDTAEGSIPVGIVTGHDDNVWFTLAGPNTGAKGGFGKIDENGQVTFFHLTSAQGQGAGLLHMAFAPQARQPPTLYLLSSSIVDARSEDSVIMVQFDDNYTRINMESVYTLPTQKCRAHRVMAIGNQVFATELDTSTVATLFIGGIVRDEDSDRYGTLGDGVQADKFEYEPAKLASA